MFNFYLDFLLVFPGVDLTGVIASRTAVDCRGGWDESSFISESLVESINRVVFRLLVLLVEISSSETEINDNLNASYRYGIDVYNENNVNYSNKGGKTGSVATQSGVYDTWNNVKTIFDHNVSINGDYRINDDIGLTFALGATFTETWIATLVFVIICN